MSKSQCEEILAHLKSGKRITPMDALGLFGCFRLSARILDLKDEGHAIKKEIVHNNGKRFAEYYMEEV